MKIEWNRVTWYSKLAAVAVFLATFLVAFNLGVFYEKTSVETALTETAPPAGGQACTAEGKVCPDGSVVGRTGPDCSFAPCPAASATSTAGGADVAPSYDSGVRGTVSLGPTCPVERVPPDPQCADKPYATAIVAYRAGSQSAFVMGNSDANGAFTLSLPPGSYTLEATSGAAFPRCLRVSVKVPASGYASTSILCDTGIR